MKHALPGRLKYFGHHFNRTEGHLYAMDVADGPCTITLTGCAAMTQKQLNDTGLKLAHCHNHFDEVVKHLDLCVRRMQDEYPDSQWEEEGIITAMKVLAKAKKDA